MAKKPTEEDTDTLPIEEQIPVTMEEQTPPAPMWDEKTEHRILRCTLNPAEREKYGRESADLVHNITRLADQKKASASSYTAAIQEKSACLRRISGYISEGWEERKVDCRWIFECCGIDSVTGERVYHPEKKALIRTDTNEVIEITEITNEERQMAFPALEEEAT